MQPADVDEQIMQFVKKRMAEGAETVTRKEIMAVIIPADHPEYQYRPEYKHALDRLYRAQKLRALRDREGDMRYSIETDD